MIGVDALHGATLSRREAEPYEVWIRVTARTDSLDEATPVANEVERLHANGPAGGGWRHEGGA